jgi:hypothetical protein
MPDEISYGSAQMIWYAIASYVRNALPLNDRRDPANPERRRLFRGGRRCTDLRCLAGWQDIRHF